MLKKHTKLDSIKVSVNQFAEYVPAPKIRLWSRIPFPFNLSQINAGISLFLAQQGAQFLCDSSPGKVNEKTVRP
jgi:hypothetical protein